MIIDLHVSEINKIPVLKKNLPHYSLQNYLMIVRAVHLTEAMLARQDIACYRQG